MKKILLTSMIFLLLTKAAMADDTAQENQCECINQKLVLDQDEIDISYEIQNFISLHTLVNPRHLFIRETIKDKNGTDKNVYTPLNGLFFEGVSRKRALQVYEYFIQHQKSLPYSLFISDSYDEILKNKNLLVTKGYDLSEICSFDFLEYQNKGDFSCIWRTSIE